MGTEIITIPDNARFGPAMAALNDRQKKFVLAMLEFGSLNHTRCALAAGYTGDDKTMRVTAHRLAHDDKVQAAIKEEARRRLNAGSLMAVSRLLQIADDEKTDKKDKLKAIEMILNRTGLPAQTEHKVEVTHVDTDMDAIERVKHLSKRLGLDATKLLGSVGVIDGEFTEVDDDFTYDEARDGGQ